MADSRADLENKLASDNDHHRVALEELAATHDEERDTLRKAHNLLAEELETHKSMLNEARIELEQNRQLHKTDADDLRSRLTTMEEHLQSVMTERASYAAQAEELRATLDNTKSEQAGLIQEASKRESLVQELERHRSILGENQTDLQRTRDERDTLLAEKQRQDSLIKELQAQLAGAKAHKREGSNDSAPSHGSSRLARANGIPPAKLPPLTPPPTGPPPPTPGSVDFSMSSHPARTSSSSQPSRSATPDEQTTPSTSMIMSPTGGVDPKIASLIEEQAKHLEEQEAMIKTLNKQLTHCEADLQAHMDLVATLEASLTDSERNCKLDFKQVSIDSGLTYIHSPSAQGKDAVQRAGERARLVPATDERTSCSGHRGATRGFQHASFGGRGEAQLGASSRRGATSQGACAGAARKPNGGNGKAQIQIRLPLIVARSLFLSSFSHLHPQSTSHLDPAFEFSSCHSALLFIALSDRISSFMSSVIPCYATSRFEVSFSFRSVHSSLWDAGLYIPLGRMQLCFFTLGCARAIAAELTPKLQ